MSYRPASHAYSFDTETNISVKYLNLNSKGWWWTRGKQPEDRGKRMLCIKMRTKDHKMSIWIGLVCSTFCFGFLMEIYRDVHSRAHGIDDWRVRLLVNIAAKLRLSFASVWAQCVSRENVQKFWALTCMRITSSLRVCVSGLRFLVPLGRLQLFSVKKAAELKACCTFGM